MEEGDIVIDGGNAHWMDTIRREKDIRARGLHFVGSGVSALDLGVAANLLQAQRDSFGAHTYERTDEERGRFFHVGWPVDGRPEIKV